MGTMGGVAVGTVLVVFMVLRIVNFFLDLVEIVTSSHRVFLTQGRDLLNNRLHDKLDTDFHRTSQVRDEDADKYRNSIGALLGDD